jgi:hypothetical protein
MLSTSYLLFFLMDMEVEGDSAALEALASDPHPEIAQKRHAAARIKTRAAVKMLSHSGKCFGPDRKPRVGSATSRRDGQLTVERTTNHLDASSDASRS